MTPTLSRLWRPLFGLVALASLRISAQVTELPQTVALINQERANNKLYAAFVQARPAVYSDDKALPSLPASVLNVMQNGRTSNRHLLTSAESAVEQAAIPFDFVPGIDTLGGLEQRMIRQAMKRARNVRTEAAKLLGISRYQLLRRMEKYGIHGRETDED